jgi:Ferric uptake regulator family
MIRKIAVHDRLDSLDSEQPVVYISCILANDNNYYLVFNVNNAEPIETLRRGGLKAPGLRVALLTALARDHTPPTAEQLYAMLRPQYPSVSLSTVSQPLDVCRRTGRCRRVSHAGDRLRVGRDAAGSRSCHLPCLRHHFGQEPAVAPAADSPPHVPND